MVCKARNIYYICQKSIQDGWSLGNALDQEVEHMPGQAKYVDHTNTKLKDRLEEEKGPKQFFIESFHPLGKSTPCKAPLYVPSFVL